MWCLLRYKCNCCDIWNFVIVLFFLRGGLCKVYCDFFIIGVSSDRNVVFVGIGKIVNIWGDECLFFLFNLIKWNKIL